MQEDKLRVRVVTVQPEVQSPDWTSDASEARRWGVGGTIIGRDHSRGLAYAYRVEHDDGSTASYEPRELRLINELVSVAPSTAALRARDDLTVALRTHKVTDESFGDRRAMLWGASALLRMYLSRGGHVDTIVRNAGESWLLHNLKSSLLTLKAEPSRRPSPEAESRTSGPFGGLVDSDLRYSMTLEPERFSAEQRLEWGAEGPRVGELWGAYRTRAALQQPRSDLRDDALWGGGHWIAQVVLKEVRRGLRGLVCAADAADLKVASSLKSLLNAVEALAVQQACDDAQQIVAQHDNALGWLEAAKHQAKDGNHSGTLEDQTMARVRLSRGMAHNAFVLVQTLKSRGSWAT